jgi:hypothetical protein
MRTYQAPIQRCRMDLEVSWCLRPTNFTLRRQDAWADTVHALAAGDETEPVIARYQWVTAWLFPRLVFIGCGATELH